MNKRQLERRDFWVQRFEDLGVSAEDRDALRRISMTLDRWHEGECGGSNAYCSWNIERENPDTREGKAYKVVYHNYGSDDIRRYQIPDLETGALKRLRKIVKRYPHLTYYVQGDPRGGALYLIPKNKIGDGQELDCIYSQVGVYANYD